MVRYTLGLCAGLLAAAVAACVPPVEPPPAPIISPPALIRAAEAASPAFSTGAGQVCDPNDLTGESFVNAIQLLQSPSVPVLRPAGLYRRPTGSPFPWLGNPNADPIRQDLIQAFVRAPDYFRKFLCSLNGIYINALSCPDKHPRRCSDTAYQAGAWGYRSPNEHQNDLGFMYIAISANLWPSGRSAVLFHEHQTQILRDLLPAGSNVQVSPNSEPNTSWITVLAALAHEVGHVVWAKTTIREAGKKYTLDSLIHCAAVDFFTGWDYNRMAAQHPRLVPPDRWRGYKKQDTEAGPGSRLHHKDPPSLDALENPATANSALYDLYQRGQPWASLFGAQTADEDFVETYAMAVLTGYDPSTGTFAGPLRSMPVIIPGTPDPSPDVPKDLVQGNKGNLLNKMKCIPY